MDNLLEAPTKDAHDRPERAPSSSRPLDSGKSVWKPLGLLRLTRSLLGGGIALRCSAVLTERLEEHQNISEANLAHGDCDDIIGVALTLR